MVTSIQLQNKTKSKLDKMKVFPRESYDDIVNRLINVAHDDEGILIKNTIKDLENSLADVKAGKLVSHDEVKRKHGL